MDVRAAGAVQRVPARLSVFRLGDDGRLGFARSYDIEVGKLFMWWMGMLALRTGGSGVSPA